MVTYIAQLICIGSFVMVIVLLLFHLVVKPPIHRDRPSNNPIDLDAIHSIKPSDFRK